MKNLPPGLNQPSFVQYIVCYVVWFCLAVMTIWLLLQVQTNLMIPLRLSGMDYRQVTVINDVTLILMGFAALIVIILLEHLLRTSLRTRRFWTRVARTIVIEAIVLGISYAVIYLLPKVLLRG